jgi:hypothetical protein
VETEVEVTDSSDEEAPVVRSGPDMELVQGDAKDFAGIKLAEGEDET